MSVIFSQPNISTIGLHTGIAKFSRDSRNAYCIRTVTVARSKQLSGRLVNPLTRESFKDMRRKQITRCELRRTRLRCMGILVAAHR